jgi:hypothetical protein
MRGLAVSVGSVRKLPNQAAPVNGVDCSASRYDLNANSIIHSGIQATCQQQNKQLTNRIHPAPSIGHRLTLHIK